jgi:CheY-like chemotaxis protein
MKILALGNDIITKRVSEIMTGKGYEVNCSCDFPKSLNVQSRCEYNLAVVDSGLENAEEICFRLIWLFRIRVILVTNDKGTELSNLQQLGIESFLTIDTLEKQLADEIESVIRLGKFQFKPIKCLLVEDDVNIRETIKLSFEVYWPEAEVLETDKGFEGAIIAGNKPVDIILLDLGLPDMHGFDLLTWLHGFSDIPVIIVTANSNRENVVKALSMRADDYVVKPFMGRDLILRIKRVLDRVEKGERFTIQMST